MTKAAILHCNIQPAGSPFRVLENFKDTTFGPGTKGYLSYIQGPDNNNPNIVFHQLVTTRRGKGGKERINNNMILHPIFYVPGLDDEVMFPTEADRKNFVAVETDGLNTKKFKQSPNGNINVDMFGWLLSKCLLLRELDKAVYPPDHQIMTSAGLGGSKQMNIWPKDKTNKLKKFTEKIERYYNEGATELITDEFSNPDARAELVAQMKAIDSALVIPRLEYNRRVLGVILEALTHVSKTVNAKGMKVESKDELNASFKATKKFFTTTRNQTEALLKLRLKTINEDRQLLEY